METRNPVLPLCREIYHSIVYRMIATEAKIARVLFYTVTARRAKLTKQLRPELLLHIYFLSPVRLARAIGNPGGMMTILQ